MGASKTGLAVVGGVVGGGAGLLLGFFAMYGLASLLTKSREAQAYLTLVIVPSVGLLGAITGAAVGAVLGGKRGLATPVAAVGAMLVVATIMIGFAWHRRTRPADVSVRNASTIAFTNVYLGGDFRRSTRIGDLAPGETSTPVPIDLDRPETFNALEGRAGGGYVRHRLTGDELTALADGDYVWVVGGTEGELTYSLEPAR